MMFSGTFLVLVFSNPMVDVLDSIGLVTGTNPFYAAFVVAPIASNASELVAAYNYAVKKTERSITVSITCLQGAACMNNTFCLSIFLALIWYRELSWNFSAECGSILIVEIIMAIYSYSRRIQRMVDAYIILMLYPLSLVLVYS